MRRAWLARVRRDDRGFTLPELIISMVVLSFIMGAIGLTLVVVLKNANAATDRVTAGGGAQTLSAWFPGDVQSAQAVGGGDSQPGTATVCPAGDDGSRNVITMRRADGTGDLVSYRLKDLGTGEHQLWRVTCTTAGVWRRQVVAQGITDPALVKVSGKDLDGADLPDPITADDSLGTVALSLSVGRDDAVQLLVSGTPRTPGLPTPCTMLSGAPPTVQLDDGDTVAAAITFTVNTSGECGKGTPPTLSIATGITTLEPALGGGPNTWSVVVQPGPRWTVGTHTATLVKDGLPSGSFTVDAIPQPCQVVSMTPSELQLEPNGRLRDDERLRLDLSGGCGTVTVSIVTGDGPPIVDRSTNRRQGTYEFTLTRGDGPWQEVPDRDVIVSSDGQPIGSAKLALTDAPCRVIGGTPVVLVTEADPRRIRPLGETALQVFTTGKCEGTLVANVPVDDTTVAAVTVTPTGQPGVWQGLLDAQGWTLTPPAKDVMVTLNGTPVPDAFPMAVSDCALIDGSATSTVLLDDDHNRLNKDQVLDFSTTGTCGPAMSVTLDPPGGEGLRAFDAVSTGAQPDGTLTWHVRLPDQLDWNQGAPAIPVLVYDTGARPPDPSSFAGSFPVQAV